MMRRIRRIAGLVLYLCLWAATHADAADKVRFGTSWLAEPEHGGFYQAVVDGTYARFGLEVTIVPGGPQASNELLLPAGRIDFYMGDTMLQAFSAVEQHVPIVVVAAFFQKNPQVLMSHPGVGHDSFDSLKSAPIFVTKGGLVALYRWLESQYGFSDDKVRPYTFNPAPFIADKSSVQQGYLTSEPYAVEQQGHLTPNVFLLADYGFSTYANTIEARLETVTQHPELVQRFIDASAIGWSHYLYGDNTMANAAIKHDNPDIDDQQIAYSIAKLRQYSIVDSGDAATLGVGAMTDARHKDFFSKMVKAGVVSAELDFKKAYTLQFVNKKVGLDLRPKD